MRPPVQDGEVKVNENIAEHSHLQYQLEVCKRSEEGLKEHGMNLGTYLDAPLYFCLWG